MSYQALQNQWRKTELRWLTEAGRPRCEAKTRKGTRCSRISNLTRVPWIDNEWRCYQHGG